MPTPIDFKGRNVIFAEHQDEYQNLPAMVVNQGTYADVYTCWEFTPEELTRVVNNGGAFILKQLLPIVLDGDGSPKLAPLQPIMPMAELGDDLQINL